jgi:hypothetical protein
MDERLNGRDTWGVKSEIAEGHKKMAGNITWAEANPLFRDTWTDEDAARQAFANPKIMRLTLSIARTGYSIRFSGSTGGKFESPEDLQGEIHERAWTHIHNHKGISFDALKRKGRQDAQGSLINFFRSRSKDACDGADAHTLGERATTEVPNEDLSPAVPSAFAEVSARQDLIKFRKALGAVGNPNHRLAYILLYVHEILNESDVNAATELAQNAEETRALLRSHWVGQEGMGDSRSSRRTLAWIFFCADKEMFTSPTKWREEEPDAMARAQNRLSTWANRCMKQLNERED